MSDRHTITIGTKRQATAASVDTLFHPIDGKTATRKIRYDMGKYAHNGRGRKVDVRREVVAIWMERRKDRDGPYWVSFCYCTG